MRVCIIDIFRDPKRSCALADSCANQVRENIKRIFMGLLDINRRSDHPYRNTDRWSHNIPIAFNSTRDFSSNTIDQSGT